MGKWTDLVGTTLGYLRLGLSGVRLKNDTGNLLVRNAADAADAAATMSKLNVSGDEIDINSDAAGADADWKMTLKRPATGMAAAVTLTLPPTTGSAGQALSTDGAGVLTWADAGDTTLAVKVDGTNLAHGSSSPVAAMTLPEDSRILRIIVRVTEAFNGTAPTASVGITGTTSKYMAATQMDLKTVGLYEVHPAEEPVAGDEDVIITYSADSSDAGAAVFEIYYAEPA